MTDDDRNKEILAAMVRAVSCPDCNVLVGTDTETGQTHILHGNQCPSQGQAKQAEGVGNDEPLPGRVIMEFNDEKGNDHDTQAN